MIVDAETRAEITALVVLAVDGDHVPGALDAAAEVARASIRPTDRTYRLDERSVAVVMPATDLATACQVAERVREAVAWGDADGPRPPATASIGVSSCTGGDPARLVARATDACREAAVEGDRVVARW